MPDKAQDDHPRVFKTISNWIGGITAVILAIVGLKAAYTQLFPPAPTNHVIPENQVRPTPVNPTGNEVANVTDSVLPPSPAAPKADGLPLRYSKPRGFLEFRHGFWVETDINNGVEFTFREVSRKGGTTVAFDESRNMTMRWPNEGGEVEWSNTDPPVWHNLYMVDPT
jgi:hypothetical protein